MHCKRMDSVLIDHLGYGKADAKFEMQPILLAEMASVKIRTLFMQSSVPGTY